MFYCNSNRISFSVGIKEKMQILLVKMLSLLNTIIVIFTFEMSFVICVLSDHYVFLLHLLHSTMHIYLQNRCINFSKQRIKKNFTLLRRERVSFISEEKDTMFILQDNIFCNYTSMFATPSFC